jgi:prolipoprotein diacylglyceryltransferase
VAIHYQVFGFNPLKWIDVLTYPGVLSFAGLVMAGWFFYRRAEKNKWNSFEILDFGAMAVTASSALMSLASFFDGSGLGKPTKLPWGVTFQNVFDKRHPAQLYAMALYIILFLFMSWAESRYRTFSWYRDKKHSAQTGFLFCSYLIGYGLIGSLISLVALPTMVVNGFVLDLPLRVGVLVVGLLLLYSRTGRPFSPFHRPKPAPFEMPNS